MLKFYTRRVRGESGTRELYKLTSVLLILIHLALRVRPVAPLWRHSTTNRGIPLHRSSRVVSTTRMRALLGLTRFRFPRILIHIFIFLLPVGVRRQASRIRGVIDKMDMLAIRPTAIILRDDR